MTFEDWFYGSEGAGARCAIALEETNAEDIKALKRWLEAAYKEGYNEGRKDEYDNMANTRDEARP